MRFRNWRHVRRRRPIQWTVLEPGREMWRRCASRSVCTHRIFPGPDHHRTSSATEISENRRIRANTAQAHRLKPSSVRLGAESGMRMQKPAEAGGEIGPETRSELHRWVRQHVSLPPDEEQALLDAFDSVFMHHERLWQQSKQEAIHAISAGFAERL